MTTSDFQPSPAMIVAVAEWHERRPADRIRRPLIPYLRQRFNLNNAEAIAVLRRSPPPDEHNGLKARIVAALINGGGFDVA